MRRARVADRHAHRALELIGELHDAFGARREPVDAVEERVAVAGGQQGDEVVARAQGCGKHWRRVVVVAVQERLHAAVLDHRRERVVSDADDAHRAPAAVQLLAARYPQASCLFTSHRPVAVTSARRIDARHSSASAARPTTEVHGACGWELVGTIENSIGLKTSSAAS